MQWVLGLTHNLLFISYQLIEVRGETEPHLLQLAESAESFLQLCPKLPRDKATGSFEESIPSSSAVPANWAETLLERQPGLKCTRFQLVPSKISEEKFWDRYFAGIFLLIAAQLCELHGVSAVSEKKRRDVKADRMFTLKYMFRRHTRIQLESIIYSSHASVYYRPFVNNRRRMTSHLLW